MTRNQKIVITALYAAAAVSGIKYLQVRREERAKRAEIDANLARDLAAFDAAAARMMERIANGEFTGTPTYKLVDEFEFETIAAHFND